MKDLPSQQPEQNKNELSPEKTAETARPAKTISVIQTLGTILIVLGILGMLLPFFNSFLLRRNSAIDLHDITPASMREALKDSPPVPFDAIREIGYVSFWSQLGQWETEDIIGELVIPNVDIDLAIFKNTENRNLLAGVGRLFVDREPGDTNFVVTGHHVSGKGVLLHNLMEAHVGDTIYVTDKAQIYVYEVIDTVQKDIDALYMLDIDRNRDYSEDAIISIMTCYQGKSSSRWFVIGGLRDVIPYQEDILEEAYPQD